MGRSHVTIDISSLSQAAVEKLVELDATLVGSYEYLGLAYFWNHEYRHYLRSCTIASRRRVHHKMLDKGLVLTDISPVHEEIILRNAKGYK